MDDPTDRDPQRRATNAGDVDPRPTDGHRPSGAITDETTELAADIDLTQQPRRVDLHDPAARMDVEQALTAVPGLIGSRLVPGFDRDIDELHVLTTLDRHPKQTVRDVQTVLMARFGLPTDHRVISVVQLEEGQGLPITSRVAIAEVGLRRVGESMVAEVALERDGEVVRTTGEAPTTSSGRHRAIARATIAAVQQMLDEAPAVELEGVEMVTVGGSTLAVTVLEVQGERTGGLLSGTAIVRDTPQDAIARSVLDATNRILGSSGS